MFETETAIILGAGASMPYNFPSGRNLKFEIVRELNQGILNTQRGYDPDQASLIYRTILEHNFSRQAIESFAKDLGGAIQPSIDSSLEVYTDYIEMGKIAIAASLIPHKKLDALTYIEQDYIKWYECFFNLLGSPDDIAKRKRLSIITINYDRSLEYFLYNGFMRSFKLDTKQAIELMKLIPILHIYGELGLPRFLSGDGREYDATVNSESIRKCVEGIKIMPEVEDSYSTLKQVHKTLSEAGKLVIIGFSFHPVNVRRLRLGETYKGKIVGTVKGMQDGEISRLKRRCINTVFMIQNYINSML